MNADTGADTGEDSAAEAAGSAGAGLSWSASCVRQTHVMLSLHDGDRHTASVEMAAEEAVDLAQVLVHEMHGSCADVWLVERQADREHLWLTLSATSRGMVRISRIELSSDIAGRVAASLRVAAAECQPIPTVPDRLHRVLAVLYRSLVTADRALPMRPH